MATRRQSGIEPSGTAPKRRRRATTPEARENQLIALAYDLAERKLTDGSASSQEVTHFLKLGSSREKLEQERLAMEVEIGQAKIEMMQSAKRVEEMYAAALTAMRSYAGQAPLQMEIGLDDED